jgi:hypothetical protein
MAIPLEHSQYREPAPKRNPLTLRAEENRNPAEKWRQKDNGKRTAQESKLWLGS